MTEKAVLFSDDERYTDLALEIERELIEAIRPVIAKYRALGVRVRDLQLLGINAVTDESLNNLLDWK